MPCRHVLALPPACGQPVRRLPPSPSSRPLAGARSRLWGCAGLRRCRWWRRSSCRGGAFLSTPGRSGGSASDGGVATAASRGGWRPRRCSSSAGLAAGRCSATGETPQRPRLSQTSCASGPSACPPGPGTPTVPRRWPPRRSPSWPLSMPRAERGSSAGNWPVRSTTSWRKSRRWWGGAKRAAPDGVPIASGGPLGSVCGWRSRGALSLAGG